MIPFIPPRGPVLSRPRARGLAIALVFVAIGAVAIRDRMQARLPDQLRKRAAAAGMVLKLESVKLLPWRTTLRALEVTFAGTPGVKAVADVATLRSGSRKGSSNAGADRWPAIAVEHLHLTVEPGAPADLYQLVTSAAVREVPLTWQHLDVTYSNRLTGVVRLDDVTVVAVVRASGADAPPLVLHVGRVTVGGRHWDDVTLAVQHRGQMLEMGVASQTIAGAPVVLGIFPSQGGSMGFMATIAHPPVEKAAGALGVGLGSAFRESGTRVGGSVSFTVPDDVARPISARLELIFGGWPAPAAPDAAVVLGKTVGLGARLMMAADRATATLDPVRMSTSLFSLAGSGRLILEPEPRVILDLSGALTCAQIRGNLPPSEVLTAVSRYLDGAAAPGTKGTSSASRAAEKATMRVQLDATLAHTEAAHLAWQVDAGCGLTGFAFGTFAAPDLVPARVGH